MLVDIQAMRSHRRTRRKRSRETDTDPEGQQIGPAKAAEHPNQGAGQPGGVHLADVTSPLSKIPR
jgi:hypothetical protein